MGFPLRWSDDALSKRFDAHSIRGRVSRHSGATSRTPCRHFKSRKRPVQTSTPRRNLGSDPCAPLGVHLTSQQHRSASTTSTSRYDRFSSASSTQDTAADGPPPGVLVRHEGLTQ
ncbi:hypothetical protein SNL152K_2947 [Streptomyces sp. NL15-2K]|nr:hypothetical protein SNL152K_2947 [Streptomyces sp. NL15-2K]